MLLISLLNHYQHFPGFVYERARHCAASQTIEISVRRPGVTLLLVWQEYREGQEEGYGYSRFRDLYAAWRGRLSPTMRQTHPAGERMFVDYAGQTVEVIDGATGEIRRAQIFVAALGASNFTYAEARWTQALPDWIGCHVGAFTSFGGVTHQIVCDNLKAGVTAACRYEPGIISQNKLHDPQAFDRANYIKILQGYSRR